MDWELKPIRFISEPVSVVFDDQPLLEKKPGCPSGFTWQGKEYRVVKSIAEWFDYQRRGRAARNMRPTHMTTALQRGSWGVGQYYFRVLTEEGNIFDLYYDRAPKDADHRKGEWYLYRELASPDQSSSE